MHNNNYQPPARVGDGGTTNNANKHGGNGQQHNTRMTVVRTTLTIAVVARRLGGAVAGRWVKAKAVAAFADVGDDVICARDIMAAVRWVGHVSNACSFTVVGCKV